MGGENEIVAWNKNKPNC